MMELLYGIAFVSRNDGVELLMGIVFALAGFRTDGRNKKGMKGNE